MALEPRSLWRLERRVPTAAISAGTVGWLVEVAAVLVLA
jgi:hypothetical protein